MPKLALKVDRLTDRGLLDANYALTDYASAPTTNLRLYELIKLSDLIYYA